MRDNSNSVRLIRLFVASAIAVLIGCSAIEPFRVKSAPGPVRAGTEYLRRNEVTKAVEEFDRAIKANPTDFFVYRSIVEACGLMQQNNLMAKYALMGADKMPQDQTESRRELLLSAGAAYDRLNDWDQMIAVSKQAVQLSPNDWQALNGLGYAYAQSGRNLTEALDLTTRAVQLAREKDVPPAGIGMVVDSVGWCYFKLRRTQEAIDTLANAAEQTPNSPEIHYHLALAYRAAGRDSDARVCLLRARTMDPKNSVIQKELTDVEAVLNKNSPKQPATSANPATRLN